MVTEKKCPECGGSGFIDIHRSPGIDCGQKNCPKCNCYGKADCEQGKVKEE